MALTNMEQQVRDLITTLDGESFTLSAEGKADLAVARFPTREFADAFTQFCRRYGFKATEPVMYNDYGNVAHTYVIFAPSQDGRL